MKREILFRGKRAGSSEWIAGDLSQIKAADHYFIDDIMVEKTTVGQYTGFKDMNGKKIFEGDVVRLENRSSEGSWTAVVEFGNPNCAYSWGYQLKRIGGEEGFNPDILLWVDMEETGATCEVIGNIYDNPELLEGRRKMNKEELIKIVDKFRKSGLSNGTALGHHSGINDEIADMLEKQVPKKPDIYGDGYDDNGNLNYDTYDCPNCNTSYEIDYEKYDYCPSCGQKFDWSEEND